jgi:copper chaperone CopZ
MKTAKLAIQGMQGPQDAQQIDQVLRGVWGVREVAMQADKAEVTFTYDERAAKFEDFKTAILDRGFGVIPLDQPES